MEEAIINREIGPTIYRGNDQPSRDEKRFADLVNAIDGIVWEAQVSSFSFTYVNSYAELLLGYAVEDWYQEDFWIEIMHPEDKAWVTSYSQDCVKQQINNYELEYRVYAKDGREVWLRDLITVSHEPGKPSCQRGIMIDISQQKRIELEIETSQARFLAMFETSPVGILLVDASTDNIIEMNRAYCELVGRDRKAVLREGWQSYTHPEDPGGEIDNVDELCQGDVDSYHFQKRYIKPNGDLVTVQQQVVPIEGGNKRDDAQYMIIIEDITARQSFEEKIWHQANYDYLTDLPNRAMFQKLVGQLIKDAPRSKQKLAIFMIDLDGFKNVNDALGHDNGDKLLVQAGDRINSCIRETDTLARLGGDEFVIVLPYLNQISGVERVATDIVHTLEQEFDVDSEQVFVSASIGITTFPQDGDQVMDLLKNADQAMYLAKQKGRNRYQFFTQDLQNKALNRMTLVNDLRTAIVERQFELYYQPIIDISSGKVFKAEALIRWHHAERGLVSPDEFIPLAEETRMIIDIGDWVFRSAIDQRKKWDSIFEKDFQISINASPIQFETSFDSDLIQHLREAEVNGLCIGIEITETLFMTSNDQVAEKLAELRQDGIQISLDDFGTGYSSLSYLKNFDIDYLKIDRSFVQNLAENSDDLVLCEAIIMMAHQLGIKVIVEGIETEDQLKLLRSIDCDYGQGYYISQPIPAAEFAEKFGPLAGK
ncbi:MAG: diguanylate cyclase (GGDEF)-like protein/PAS domain S-box-containing protein [Planctomycetota bacterium]